MSIACCHDQCQVAGWWLNDYTTTNSWPRLHVSGTIGSAHRGSTLSQWYYRVSPQRVHSECPNNDASTMPQCFQTRAICIWHHLMCPTGTGGQGVRLSMCGLWEHNGISGPIGMMGYTRRVREGEIVQNLCMPCETETYWLTQICGWPFCTFFGCPRFHPDVTSSYTVIGNWVSARQWLSNHQYRAGSPGS